MSGTDLVGDGSKIGGWLRLFLRRFQIFRMIENYKAPKCVLRQAYNAVAWVCTILVIAMSMYAGFSGEVPLWMAAAIVGILGAMSMRAMYRTARRPDRNPTSLR